MKIVRCACAAVLALAIGACGSGTTDEGGAARDDGGLAIEILKEGGGPEIAVGQTAVVHYTGWFDAGGWKKGESFDSSVERGQPLVVRSIGNGPVIAGWNQGIPPHGGRDGMKVGEKRRILIPYALAYGERGKPPVIPPRSNLIFEVELLEIQ